jgi:oxygen-independent coproporphyrinogen-3 oxidase
MCNSVGIYIHIPFCHHRCTYCDFNIYAGMRALRERYVTAVATEVASAPAGLPVPTIYLGGGTPSLLPAEQIARLLNAIRAQFAVAPDAEITLEANPRTADDGYFDALRALGANRVSLGMQSAIERDLHLFRRGHTFGDVVQTVRLARSAGFENLNLDLIYGIPGQSPADWRHTLEAALSLEPDHVSAYCLQVEDGTTLKKWIVQGKVFPPDDEVAADMYNLAEDILEQAGFVHYEISNWARRNSNSNFKLQTSNLQSPITNYQNSRYTCKHNLIYWRNEPYLGFGCGAHSWFGGRRFSKVRHPRAYVDAIEAGQGAEAESEPISRRLEMGETMMLGLRLLEEGVRRDQFAARFGVDIFDVYRDEIERLVKKGLIEAGARRLRLSRRGRLVGNRVFAEFL